MEKQTKVTMDDASLISKCTLWISNLCRTGGRAWVLNVPVDFNNDPDVLFSELITRYENRASKSAELAATVRPVGAANNERDEIFRLCGLLCPTCNEHMKCQLSQAVCRGRYYSRETSPVS
jgi:hypothetical protein